MTTTLHPNRSGSNGAKPPRDSGITPTLRRQRNRPVALVAGACALAGLLGFVGIWAASSDKQAVLAVSRPVKAGDAITAEDLSIASISADPALKPIPATARADVIGKTAAVDLATGALLVDSQLGTPTGVGEGEAVVAVEVPLASAPIDAIHTGDRVRIVKTAKGGDSKEALGEVITEGRVTHLAPGSTSAGSTVVSVVVPADQAPAVAGASSSQRAALIVLPREGR